MCVTATIQTLKPEFDPDLEVNDSISQNLVSHQKHGDDPVTLRVVVKVKRDSVWKTVQVCGGDQWGWQRLPFGARTLPDA